IGSDYRKNQVVDNSRLNSAGTTSRIVDGTYGIGSCREVIGNVWIGSVTNIGTHCTTSGKPGKGIACSGSVNICCKSTIGCSGIAMCLIGGYSSNNGQDFLV